MPADFCCTSCHLSFSVGRYHHHKFSSGFGSTTLLACLGCGTNYRVEHPVEKDQKSRWWAQPAPVTNADGDSIVITHIREWQLWETNQDLELSQCTCHYCKKQGLLSVEGPPDGAQCPRCHNLALGCIASWIT